jgi:thiosulfate/3-mercaptopyruvate sulfurtransferase
VTDSRSDVLITVDDLAARASDTAGLVILDVSDDLEASPLERPVIPGAIAVSLASDLSGPATKLGGRRPLPDPDVLQENLRRWGIDTESLVIVYDNASGAQAGRAWWTLRWAGHTKVRLLDGGLAAWTTGGHETAAQPVHPAGTGGFTVIPGGLPVIDADEAAGIARNGTLLDARGRTAYEGEADKPATGHIPGAICAAASNTLGADGCFKSTEDLRALFAGRLLRQRQCRRFRTGGHVCRRSGRAALCRFMVGVDGRPRATGRQGRGARLGSRSLARQYAS